MATALQMVVMATMAVGLVKSLALPDSFDADRHISASDKKPVEPIVKMMKSGYSKVASSQFPPVDKIEETNTIKYSTTVSATKLLDQQRRKQFPAKMLPDSDDQTDDTIPGLSNSYITVKDHNIPPTNTQESVLTYNHETDASVEYVAVPEPYPPTMSVKDSLAIFMRENMYAANQPTQKPQDEENATPTTTQTRLEEKETFLKPKPGATKEKEFATMMRKKLSAFVKQFMSGPLQAEIHEIRVEHRENGLHDYNRT